VSEKLLQYFEVEARELCGKLAALVAADTLPSRDSIAEMLSAARTLRGGATMARLTPFAVLAGQLERVLKSVVAGRLAWTPPLAESLRGATEDLRTLIDGFGHWGVDEDERAHARSLELSRYATPAAPADGDRIVPIGSLFAAGAGPHIVYVAVTPQTQFESQLRDLAQRKTPPATAARATPPEPAVRTAPREERRIRTPTAPRGHELRELLEVSVSRLSGGYAPYAPPADSELLPIESLVYDSRGALARARELAPAMLAAGRDARPEMLSELIDLIELAARD
jgi:chemotaxis protein histidine kinase CheA